MVCIALVGASSQIAKDFIRLNALNAIYELILFVRDVQAMTNWLDEIGLADRFPVYLYGEYGKHQHDVVINFVGVGDPSRAAQMGGDILDITLRFDDLIISQLLKNPMRRYIFISSGAVYGGSFSEPADATSVASYDVNHITLQNYYSIAKLHAEVRHRSLRNLSIIDVRVFNYFSRYQGLGSRFFIVDILNAIKSGSVLRTSSEPISRDFLHPTDFFQLIGCCLASPCRNFPVDAYTKAPIGKLELLETMARNYGLQYEIVCDLTGVVGSKQNYYSTNMKARELGYQPKYSSLDTLNAEVSAILEGDDF
ncbi:NAD(P)-dependent oxidoreductase [Pseudomonas sp. ENNP23]|uniref:NAD-dependent epimerase/dehydratase family protein n=1 Tax=Pseudomonas sp. ENNP23 TaxID=1535636 RepID=UPI00084B42EA|nr:NAD(P)-dependent oxidoreductase [Pseudomonas sp. ENNP23]OEC59563.1 epimerase [Pseudomonas sp. ENNP23]